MEMHFVHKSPAGTLAVVGVFIEQGAHDTAFDPIWETF
jgi:carbonic anhydrase